MEIRTVYTLNIPRTMLLEFNSFNYNEDYVIEQRNPIKTIQIDRELYKFQFKDIRFLQAFDYRGMKDTDCFILAIDCSSDESIEEQCNELQTTINGICKGYNDEREINCIIIILNSQLETSDIKLIQDLHKYKYPIYNVTDHIDDSIFVDFFTSIILN